MGDPLDEMIKFFADLTNAIIGNDPCAKSVMEYEEMERMEQEIKAVLDDLVNTAEKIDKLKSDDIEKFLGNAVDITPIKSLFRNRYKGFKIILSHKDGNPGVEFIYKKGKAEVRAGWKPYEFGTREYEFGTKVDTEVAKKILDYLNKTKFKKVKTTT